MKTDRIAVNWIELTPEQVLRLVPNSRRRGAARFAAVMFCWKWTRYYI